MAKDQLAEIQQAVEALEGAVIPVPDLEKQVRDIKDALVLISDIVTDLIQERAETPTAYAKDLADLKHTVGRI